MSIDELLLSLDQRFRLANLFELDDGRWRASMCLRLPDKSGDYHYEFGDGATPSEALFAAFEKTKETL
jgi:hypothetical protein